MPAGYGIRDHRLFVLDFLTSSLIGHDPPKIVRAAARRLNTGIPTAERNYINRMEELISQHRIVERVGQAHANSTSKASLKIKLDGIDDEHRDHMLPQRRSAAAYSLVEFPFHQNPPSKFEGLRSIDPS